MDHQKPRPHGRRYPWTEWFARGTVTLRRGVDFDCLPHGMAQAARNAAGRLGYSLEVQVKENEIVIRATERNGAVTTVAKG